MHSDGDLRAAEIAILNAPFEPGGWRTAVEHIMSATGSSGAHLLGMGGPLLLPLNLYAGDIDGIEAYEGNALFHGAINWRVGTVTVPMAIQHEQHYAAYRQLHDTADYDDAASDLDILYGCQSALLLDANSLMGIAMLRSRRDGPCDSAVLARFARLRHRLARAVRAQIALDGEAADLMLGQAEHSYGTTLLLDRHGSLCALTPRAEAAIEKGPLRLDGLHVRLRCRAEDRSYQAALARLLGHDDAIDAPIHQRTLATSDPFPGRRWRMTLSRLPSREHGLGFEPQLAVSLRQLA